MEGSRPDIQPNSSFSPEDIRESDKVLLSYATYQALHSAVDYSVDLPVGAALMTNGNLIGSHASDQRLDMREAHAEYMVLDKAKKRGVTEIDTLAVTLEPCSRLCQKIIDEAGVKRVVFLTPRKELEDRGMVNRHDNEPSIFEQNLPYQVVHYKDELLTTINHRMLDHVTRDRHSGKVDINVDELQATLTSIKTDLAPQLIADGSSALAHSETFLSYLLLHF